MAVKKINRTFERIKNVVPGMVKEGTKGKVTAKRVLDFLPFDQLLVHDYSMAIFDADPFEHKVKGVLKSFRDA